MCRLMIRQERERERLATSSICSLIHFEESEKTRRENVSLIKQIAKFKDDWKGNLGYGYVIVIFIDNQQSWLTAPHLVSFIGNEAN